ncbi:uncharacterized protein LOC133911898 isoform X2 [Phragmites australis]|uniref:uncharacterized protein LOC133911898 isoform X2 n=1 Tax=Phragmites australis TaxID=29695 RepID=UPI002D768ED1|nr:uncharacterized protein LOC133911898 isoform X2 [Phragmites australis]
MAQAAWPPGRHKPSPSHASYRPSPARPPTPPAARRPDTPRRAAQDTPCATSVDGSISGNMTHSQCKEASKHTQNEVHHTNEAMSRAKGILRPDSSDKHKMPRSSGGTYSKPDARVKLIPAEEITYVQHRKSYCRTAGSVGLQKRHCRRSVTPPPSSRKVSLVGSMPHVQKPTPLAPSYNTCLPPKRLETAENGHSYVGGNITSSVTQRIASLKNHAPPSCKSSQPSSNSLNTDAFARNLGRMDITEAFSRCYGSRISHSQGQGSKKPQASFPKEAAINPISPSPKQLLATHSSGDQLGTKAESSSKSVCTPENGELSSRGCNLATRSTAAPVLQLPIVEPALLSQTSVFGKYPDRIRTAAPILQKPIVKHVLPSPISLLSERSTEVYPNSKSELYTSTNLFNVKCDLASLQHKNTPTHSPQSMTPAQCNALSKGRNPMASANGDTSSGEKSNEVYPNSKPGLCTSTSLISGKCDLASLQHKNIPPTHSPQSTTPAQCNALSKERNPAASITGDTSSESRHESIGIQETGGPVILHTKLHKKHYQSEARWKGNFHVTGELRHTCDGLEAHFPFEIDVRVYEASKQMPKNLNLEALPLSQLWPKKFKMKPPDGPDIGLWFISSHKRPHRSFDHLLEKISSRNGLCTNIGDTELAIFSSKLLTPDHQRKDGKFFFWGVFGKRLRKKQCQPNNHIKNMKISNPCQPIGMKLDVTEGRDRESAKSDNGMTLDARGGEERDMGKSEEIDNTMDVTGNEVMVRDKSEEIALVLDLTGGNKTDRVNECATVIRTPDSNPASSSAAPAASFLDGCCSLDSSNSLCQPAIRSSSDSDLVLDTSSGFSLDLPPGFTKVHSQLSAGATAVSCIDAFPTDIPPGFTEAHRQLSTITSAGPETGASTPVTEKKSLVSLSPNVPRPVRTIVPPGCTALLAVKKEPGSPAVDKAIEKRMPSSFASGASSISLVLDTPGFPTDIPPGFTEAHRQLPTITSTGPETGASTPVTEKKHLVSFSLNVPRLVRTEVTPGFTTLLAVKKEPGLSAVDKAIEKRMPSSLASRASSIRTAGNVGVTKIGHYEVRAEPDESSEEREFPRSRLLSDILELSSAFSDGNSSDTPNSTSRNRTKLGRPVSAHLPDKHREMEAPEKQVHRRKRGPQEPPEPSPADTTTKRPKVNGRIALNGVNRQALNPNRDQGNCQTRCSCASEGRVAPAEGPGSSLPISSSGDHLGSESISCRCVACGEEFPAQ